MHQKLSYDQHIGVFTIDVLNPVLSGGGNDESSSESPEGEEKESPDDETQDNNPKIAKLTGMSKFMVFIIIDYRGTSHNSTFFQRHWPK